LFHGKLSPEIARGLKVLRERIGRANIPPSILDETLNIATWNIREFGKPHQRRLRSEAAIHYIAEILFQFDLIAVVEVRDDLTDLSRVMKVLGPYWRTVFSDFNTDAAGNRERIAYLYDKRAVVFTGLAAEADPPRKKDRTSGEYVPEITWWRSPFMASFSAGNFDFILLTAHIRWGGDDAASRIPELKLLAEWIDDRRQEKYVVDKDIIVMGDFNIPQLDDELYRAITSKGLEIPDALRGTEHGSNLARDKRYDQILHYRRHTKTFEDVGGVLDFYCNDWRALFPQEQYPDMTKTGFTYELSDHLPLWAQLDTWTEDEELEQLLHR
jgi:endonuclease/exonuclease/phosphatase family metal-dependent hydrolase